MKMRAKMVPWEMARYQPIFTLSFLSSSTCVNISIKIIRMCLLQQQLHHQHRHPPAST